MKKKSAGSRINAKSSGAALVGPAHIWTSWNFDNGPVTVSVPVSFDVKVERHMREKFQADGHFVPDMRDEHNRIRDCEGPLIFVGVITLVIGDGDIINEAGKLQVLRVLADTPQELVRLINLRVRETFFANFNAISVRTKEASEMKRLVDENNALRGVGLLG